MSTPLTAPPSASSTDRTTPRMRFPASIGELTDAHRCPRCFAELAGTDRCGACGFPVGDARNRRVLELSTAAARALSERGVLIKQIVRDRDEAAARDATEQEQPPASPMRVAIPRPASAPPQEPVSIRLPADAAGPLPALEVHAGPPAPPTVSAPPPASSPEAPRRRGLGVQLTLLVLAITLLAIAAGFYLVYAWTTFDLAARATSTAAVTLAAVVGASWLRRAKLKAAAEGVAALGAALIVLDAWSLPALGLFGLDRLDPTLYWGLALIVLALVFEGWSRLTALRLPAVAASLAVVPGAGLFVAGLAGFGVEGPARFAIGAVGAAVGALVHAVWQRRGAVPDEPAQGGRFLAFATVLRQAAAMPRPVEITIVVIAGLLASGAGLISLALPLDDAGLDVLRAPLFCILAASAFAQSRLVAGQTTPVWIRELASAFAALGVVATLAAPLALSATDLPDQVWAALATAAALVAPVVLERLRVAGAADESGPRRRARFAAVAAALPALGAVAIVAVAANAPFWATIIRSIASGGTFVGRELALTERLDQTASIDGIAIGLAVGVALAAVAARRSPSVQARIRPWWLTAAVIAVVFGAWQLRVAPAVVAVLVATVAALVALLLLERRRRTVAVEPLAVRLVLWIGAALVLGHVLVAGLLHPLWSTVAAVVFVAALFTMRGAVATSPADAARSPVPARVALAAGAAAGAVVAAMQLPFAWSVDLDGELVGGSRTALLLVGTALFALAAFAPRRVFHAAESFAVAVISAIPAAIAGTVAVAEHALNAAAWPTSVVPQPLLLLIATTLFAATVVGTVVRDARSIALVAPALSAINVALPVAPFATWAALTIPAVWIGAPLGVDAFGITFVVLGFCALFAAVGSIAVRRHRAPGSSLWLLDAPALAMTSIAILGAISSDGHDLAIVSMLAALTVIAVGTTANGLIRSTDERRHVAWPAIPLLVASWLAFTETLPFDAPAELRWVPAGAIVAFAGAVIWLAGTPRATGGRAVVGPWLIGGGLALASLPVGIAAMDDEGHWRSAILLAALALVLLASVAVSLPTSWRDVATPVAVTSSASLLLVAVSRAVAAPVDVTALPMLTWMGPPLAVLALAAVLRTRASAPTLDEVGRSTLGLVAGFVPIVTLAVALVAAMPRATQPSMAVTDAASLGALIALIGLSFTTRVGLRTPAGPVAALGATAVCVAAAIPLPSAPAEVGRPLLLVAVAVALVAGIGTAVALRSERISIRLAPVVVLPFAAWALVTVASGFAAVQRLATPDSPLDFVILHGGGLVGIAGTVLGAGLAVRSRTGSCPHRVGLEIPSVLIAAIAAVQHASNASFGLLGLALVLSSLAPVRAPSYEARTRSIARWFGTPLLAIVATSIVDDWFGAAPGVADPAGLGALQAVAAGTVFMAVGVVVGVLDARRRAASGLAPGASVEATIDLALGAIIALACSVLAAHAGELALLVSVAVSTISAALLAVWALRIRPRGAGVYGVAVGVAAACSLAVVPLVRTMDRTPTGHPFAAESWGLPVVAILVAAAIVGLRHRPATMPSVQTDGSATSTVGAVEASSTAFDRPTWDLTLVSVVLATAALVTAVFPPALAMAVRDDSPWWRSPLWLLVLVALASIAFARLRSTFDRVLLYGSGAGALIVALTAIASTRVEWIEQITVPIAAGLISLGAVHLSRSQRGGSWRVVAPGIAMLLLPSTLAQFGEAPLWRIVGIGLAAVAFLAWGLAGKLQAPFLLGLGFVIAQTVTAFWIALDQANRDVPWWIWLAVAGALLLGLAIRFESNMRDARKSVATIAAMR